jgi:hypothetical protein
VPGDVVGYGPHNLECLRWMREELAAGEWVLGNHEAMLIGMLLKGNWPLGKRDQELQKELRHFALRELSEVEGIIQNYSSDQSSAALLETSTAAELVEAPPRDPIAALKTAVTQLQQDKPLQEYLLNITRAEDQGPHQISLDGVEYWLVHASRRRNWQLGPIHLPLVDLSA